MRLIEFPQKNWKKRGLDKLLKKLWETGTTGRKKGSGWPKSARTEEKKVHGGDLKESAKWPPVRCSSCAEKASSYRTSAPYVNHIQSFSYVSVGVSKLGLTDLRRSRAKNHWRLLSRRSSVPAASGCDAWGVKIDIDIAKVQQHPLRPSVVAVA